MSGPARSTRLVLAAALLLALAALAGCAAVQRQERRLWTADEFLRGRPDAPAAATLSVPPRDASPYLKAHLRDGTCVVLSEWTVAPDGREVSGQCRVFDAHRRQTSLAPCTVALDSVAIFETNVVGPSAGPVSALAVVSAASVVVTIACITNPKACFGSCPTFYADDGARSALQAEGFSASVAPSLEAADVDALWGARPAGRRLELLMRNEALETHVVRHADLLVVPRAAHERAFVTPEGEFFACGDIRSAARATGPEGDCTAALRAFDGAQRFSAADSLDLAAREEIALEFPPVAAGERWGLVIASRQTLLTTWLFYHALAALGDQAGAALAALERGDPAARARVSAVGDVLGGIELETRGADGVWRAAGWTRETGPLATDVRVVPLPDLAAGEPVALRLRLARGAWRLDWLALARLDRRCEPARVPPSRATRDGRPDEDALAALRDPARALTTWPGDDWTLAYDLPCAGDACELFLESRGYYLEWMREEWRRDENPGLAALLLTQPRAALRLLAPDYKRAEPELETAFWGSRYVRP